MGDGVLSGAGVRTDVCDDDDDDEEEVSEQAQVTLRSVGVVMSKNAEFRSSRPGRKRAERPTRAAKIRR